MHQVTVAPVTRTIRGIDAEVVLTPEHGVPTLSAISLDNIQTVRKETLNQRVTVLDQETMQEVFNAICFVFAMPGSAV
jgi:mRNA interferase MazF